MRVIKETGGKGLLLWIKANQPKLYAEFLKKRANVASKLNGLGNTSLTLGNLTLDPISTAPVGAPPPAWLSAVQQTLTGAAQVYLTAQQLSAQKKVMDLQIERARQGLAPLDIDPMRYGLSPTVGVGISPDTKKFLMWGGLGLLALLVLKKLG